MPGGRPKQKTQPDSVKSVTKVLDILEHLGSFRHPASVSDVARATGFNVSTAFRLLQTLAARGYVEQEPGHRRYLLGPRIFQLGSAYLKGSDLATLARPHIEALRDEVGETIYLVTFSQNEIVQLCKADGRQVVGASIHAAAREPAYCTATGKVMLAGLPKEDLARYMASVELRAYTPQTVTAKTKLLRELETVREKGYALDLEEFVANLCCVAVPVRDAEDGSVRAAISMAMPKVRFKRASIAGWQAALQQKALLIAGQLALIG